MIAINAPLGGVSSSQRPAPNWYASTVTWRDRPSRSEIGTSTGIVSTAWPLTLGTGTWMAVWNTIIPIAARETGSEEKGGGQPTEEAGRVTPPVHAETTR